MWIHNLKYSQLLMPSEYKKIKRVVDNLAKKNDLGNAPITFTINTGSKGAWLAEELNLCKESKCTFFSEVNPFKPYRSRAYKDINEINRQSYLYNGIEAYSYSHGIITFSRSTFKSLGSDDKKLSCLIGHELSHFLMLLLQYFA